MLIPLDFPMYGIKVDDDPSYFMYKNDERIVPLFTTFEALDRFVQSRPEWAATDISEYLTVIRIIDASGFFELAEEVRPFTDHMSLNPKCDTDYTSCYSIKSAKQFCRDLN